jgi:hypothetical protein
MGEVLPNIDADLLAKVVDSAFTIKCQLTEDMSLAGIGSGFFP